MKKLFSGWILGLLGCGMGVLILTLPVPTLEGIRQGLLLCYRQVIPSLFPFFVASSLIVSSPLSQWLGCLLIPYTKFVLGIPSRRAATALLVSWLGGFAVAARSISQIYQEGEITPSQSQRLMVCAVGSSPAFVINTVGLLFLGSSKLGLRIWLAHLVASLICAMALRFVPTSKSQKSVKPASVAPPSFGLASAIQGAVQSILVVCGFVVFFRALGQSLLHLMELSPLAQAILYGTLEVTSGCQVASSVHGAALLCAALLSGQSLSVLLQVKALLHPLLSMGWLIGIRPLHMLLTVGLFQASCVLWPVSQSVASTLAPQVIVTSQTAPDVALVVFALCCVVLSACHSGCKEQTHPAKNRPPVISS